MLLNGCSLTVTVVVFKFMCSVSGFFTILCLTVTVVVFKYEQIPAHSRRDTTFNSNSGCI